MAEEEDQSDLYQNEEYEVPGSVLPEDGGNPFPSYGGAGRYRDMAVEDLERPPSATQRFSSPAENIGNLSDEVFEGEGREVHRLKNQSGTLECNLSYSNLDDVIRILEQNNGNEGSKQMQRGSTSQQEDVAKTDSNLAGGKSEAIPDDKLMVLGPDHPKMQRFQKALREHLERQIYQTECETRDLENEMRMQKKQREELGNQLYNLQYELQRQTDLLEKYDNDLERLTRERIETEQESDDIRQEYAEAKAKLLEETNNEKRIMKSVKEIDMMEWCVRQAVEEYDGELKTRQLIDEKYEKLKQKIETEKINQDFYLDKVMTHIMRMEQANDGIQRQIQAHKEEQRELQTFIMEAEMEIEALQIEKKQLQRAWNETVSVVRCRDEALNAARATLTDTKELLKNRESELRSLQRAIAKEQEAHERATMLLKRRKIEERQLQSQLEDLQRKNDDLRNQVSLLYNIRKQMDEELIRATKNLANKEKELGAPRRKLEQLRQEKNRLEDEIVKAIQEQASLGKVAAHISQKVEAVREKTRKLESEAAKVENEMTKVTIQVEKLKGDLLNKQILLKELDKKVEEHEKVLAQQAAEVKEAKSVIQRKTAEIVRLNKKLDKLINEQGGKESSPLEREVEELERKIAEEKEMCSELQNQWLKQQDDLVTLTTKRDDMLKENDLIRKEAFILERKKQRLTREFETKQSEVKKFSKELKDIRHQISLANARLYEERVQHDKMDKDNTLLQHEFVALLREAEMEAIELQEEIRSLEEEKERLANSLNEAHEQSLHWDKKIKYARELKDSIKKEQESTGSALKLAIHHMKVRYQELCKAQEKLMQDLERSIDKRDRIIQQADYSLKRANIHPKTTKLNIQRNQNKLRERNKALLKEVLDSERQAQELEEKLRQLEKSFQTETESLQRIKDLVKASDERIHEAAIQKHNNLIEIILRQQKYKILEAIKQDKYKPLAKSPSHLQAEMTKTEAKCLKLVELSDLLMEEYPNLVLQIKLIKASILPNVK